MKSRCGEFIALKFLLLKLTATYDRDTYNYHQESLYEMNERLIKPSNYMKNG